MHVDFTFEKGRHSQLSSKAWLELLRQEHVIFCLLPVAFLFSPKFRTNTFSHLMSFGIFSFVSNFKQQMSVWKESDFVVSQPEKMFPLCLFSEQTFVSFVAPSRTRKFWRSLGCTRTVLQSDHACHYAFDSCRCDQLAKQ